MLSMAESKIEKVAQELHRIVPEAKLTTGINTVDFDMNEYLVQTRGDHYLVDGGSQYAVDRGCSRLMFELGRIIVGAMNSDDQLAVAGVPIIDACSDHEPSFFEFFAP